MIEQYSQFITEEIVNIIKSLEIEDKHVTLKVHGLEYTDEEIQEMVNRQRICGISIIVYKVYNLSLNGGKGKVVIAINNIANTIDVSIYSDRGIELVGNCNYLFSGELHRLVNLIDLTEIEFRPTSCLGMFYGNTTIRRKLNTIVFGAVDFSECKTVEDMFRDCCGLGSLDLSEFQLEQETDTKDMFKHCFNLNENNINTQDEKIRTEIIEQIKIDKLLGIR